MKTVLFSQITSAILLVLPITWYSAAKPVRDLRNPTSAAIDIEGTSENPFLNKPSSVTILEGREQTLDDFSPNTALARRGGGGESGAVTPTMHLKMAKRSQQAALFPTLLCANTLVDFWQKVALEAVYNKHLEPAKAIFTITHGLLSATFSCLGSNVPWDFVYDVAMQAFAVVRQGLVDTFDVLYEQASTGHTIWVSFRVLAPRETKPT